eukprot:5362904-Pleurochrysis_carterae.AAC.2
MAGVAFFYSARLAFTKVTRMMLYLLQRERIKSLRQITANKAQSLNKASRNEDAVVSKPFVNVQQSAVCTP